MPDKLNWFTPYARNTLINAQGAASTFRSETIGPEHLLFTLVGEGDSMACYVFAKLGITLEEFYGAILDTMGAQSAERPRAQPKEINEQAKQVIQLSIEEARRMGHHRLSTAHILLGILRLGEGRAYEILQRLGVQLEDARRMTRQGIAETGSPEANDMELSEADKPEDSGGA